MLQYASPVAETFWDYLMRITDNATGIAISRAAEVDAGNVSRWRNGKGHPSAESVVKLARVFGRPPVEALIASGHLQAGEAAAAVVEIAMSAGDLSNEELLAEIGRRMGITEGRRDDVEDAQESGTPSTGDDQKTRAAQGRDNVRDLKVPNQVRLPHWGNAGPPPSVEEADAASRRDKPGDHEEDPPID